MYREIVVASVNNIKPGRHFSVCVISGSVLTLYKSITLRTFSDKHTVIIKSVQQNRLVIASATRKYTRYPISVSVKAIQLIAYYPKHQCCTATGAGILRSEIVTRISVNNKPLSFGNSSVFSEIVLSSVYHLLSGICCIISSEIIPRVINLMPPALELSGYCVAVCGGCFVEEQTGKCFEFRSVIAIRAFYLAVFEKNVAVIVAELLFLGVAVKLFAVLPVLHTAYNDFSAVRFDPEIDRVIVADNALEMEIGIVGDGISLFSGRAADYVYYSVIVIHMTVCDR